MQLTSREHTVVTNIWGDEIPMDLRKLDTEQLIAMHDRVSRAVQASYDDKDTDSLGILLPLERKIITVLYERL